MHGQMEQKSTGRYRQLTASSRERKEEKERSHSVMLASERERERTTRSLEERWRWRSSFSGKKSGCASSSVFSGAALA